MVDIIGVEYAFAELCMVPLRIFSFFPLPGEPTGVFIHTNTRLTTNGFNRKFLVPVYK